MSPKNNILPADLLESVLALPPIATSCGHDGPLARAQEAFAQREGKAKYVRVVVYRYDGNGRGADLCDKVQTGLQSGTLPFHKICEELNADLQLIELGAGVPTPEDNARAAAFGMMAVEEDTGLLVVTAFGAEPLNKPTDFDFFAGTMPDTAAVFGAIVSAARAGIPVIAEGLKAMEAVYALYALRPDLCTHVFLCGVPAKVEDPRFNIFADDTADHPGFAGIALAKLFTDQFSASKTA